MTYKNSFETDTVQFETHLNINNLKSDSRIWFMLS